MEAVVDTVEEQPTPTTSTETVNRPSSEKARFVDVSDEVPSTTPLKFSKTFLFEYKAEDGKNYTGKFTCRRLTLGSLGEFGVIKARLNGGELVDASIDFMHEMLAYCRVAIIDAPDWWTPEEFYDAKLLRHVYDYMRLWENSFRSGGVG